MYTIKEASARSGVGAPLIRAWERRYGVVAPTRTPSGYRLYDDVDRRRPRRDAGIGRLGLDGIRGRARDQRRRGARRGRGSVRRRASRGRQGDPVAAHRAQLIARFVAAAESTSPADTEAALDEILASGSFEAVVDDLLLPAAAALGDAWAAGALSVAGEHAASAAVARRLAAVFQAAGSPEPVLGRRRPAARLAPRARGARLRRGAPPARRRRPLPRPGRDRSTAGSTSSRGRSARAAVIGVVTADDRAGGGRRRRGAARAGRSRSSRVGGAAAGRRDDPNAGRRAPEPRRRRAGRRRRSGAV